MNRIEHIIEPARLLLSWQPSADLGRGRHIVAELHRSGDEADLVYLCGAPDYDAAREKGFSGEYPGFPAVQTRHVGVLAAFMRRLPPRDRADFDKFMEAIRIQPGTSISDFALLGYAGGKLPGDDFYIIHPFDEAQPPFEFLLLIAGYRHYRDSVPYDAIQTGMPIRFELEPDHKYDPDAVRIVIPDVAEETAGYVCRGLAPQVRRWLMAGWCLGGTVERRNGMGDHPLICVFVTIRAPDLSRGSTGQTVSAVPHQFDTT